MKSSILSLVIFLVVGQLMAQSDSNYLVKPIFIEDITKSMSKGNQPGFKFDIPQAKKESVVNALTKALKEENKSKLELVNNEYIMRGATIRSISSKPMNVYTIVNEHGDHVELFFFYEVDSTFLTKEKNEPEYLAAKQFTRNFVIGAYKGAVQERIDMENNKLKDLQSQLDNMYKEQDKLKKSIDAEKHNIDNANEKIATAENDQERVRKEIQDQKAKVDEARTSNNESLQKEEEKKLKELENNLSKLEKDEDGFHNDITNSDKRVREYERNTADNDAAIKSKEQDVARQKENINQLQKLMESIQ